MPKRKSARPTGRESRCGKQSKSESGLKGVVDVSTSNTGGANSRRDSPSFLCGVHSLQVAPGAQGDLGGTSPGHMTADTPNMPSSNTTKGFPKRKIGKSETAIPKQCIETQEPDRKTSHIHVKKPDFIFTDTYTHRRRACITNNGTKIDINDMSLIGNSNARTNGRFQTGRQYWEMKISAPLCSARPVFFDICVKQEKGDGNWYLRVGYHRGKVKCSDYCFGEIEYGHGKWRPYTDPHHLGVFLNCEDRILMVFEPAENQLLFTVGDLDVSEALIPMVRFGHVKFASIELITGDGVTVPQVLCDVMDATKESGTC